MENPKRLTHDAPRSSIEPPCASGHCSLGFPMTRPDRYTFASGALWAWLWLFVVACSSQGPPSTAQEEPSQSPGTSLREEPAEEAEPEPGEDFLVVPGKQRPPHDPGTPNLNVADEHARDEWQRPDLLLDLLGVHQGMTVADVGAGVGYLTIRLARRVGPSGLVYTEEIDKHLTEFLDARARGNGLGNVRVILGEPENAKLPGASMDLIVLVDVYHHVRRPIALLRNLRHALTPEGKLAIVDWYEQGPAPPGPRREERLPESVVIEEARQAGLRFLNQHNELPRQYILLFGN